MRQILVHLKGIDRVLHDRDIMTRQPAISPTIHTHLAPLPAYILPPPFLIPAPSPEAMGFPAAPPTVPAPGVAVSLWSDRYQATPPQYPIADSAIPDEHVLTLQLDNRTLTFDRREIPDPPAQHFSSQISKLFAEWETGTLLQVSGQYIPLKHWPKIYHTRAGAKRGVWNTLKVEFANWKVCACHASAASLRVPGPSHVLILNWTHLCS